MRFEWDDNKNLSNYRKHRVMFETAREVFHDPRAVTEQDRQVDGEERWQTIGRVGDVVLLSVAHTVENDWDEEVIRIISARRANRLERRRYENAN